MTQARNNFWEEIKEDLGMDKSEEVTIKDGIVA